MAGIFNLLSLTLSKYRFWGIQCQKTAWPWNWG